MEENKCKKKLMDKNNQFFHEYGILPNGYKPIVMENIEEYLRSQGAIDTNEFLQIINMYR
jgi:hypothetical protein